MWVSRLPFALLLGNPGTLRVFRFALSSSLHQVLLKMACEEHVWELAGEGVGLERRGRGIGSGHGLVHPKALLLVLALKVPLAPCQELSRELLGGTQRQSVELWGLWDCSGA